MFDDLAMLKQFDAFDADFYSEICNAHIEVPDSEAISKYLMSNDASFFSTTLKDFRQTEKGFGFANLDFVYYYETYDGKQKGRKEKISVFIPTAWCHLVESGKPVTIKSGEKGLRVIGFYEKAPTLKEAAFSYVQMEREKDQLCNRKILSKYTNCVALKHWSKSYGRWENLYVFKGELDATALQQMGLNIVFTRQEYSTKGLPISPAYVDPTDILVVDRGTPQCRTLVHMTGGDEWTD